MNSHTYILLILGFIITAFCVGQMGLAYLRDRDKHQEALVRAENVYRLEQERQILEHGGEVKLTRKKD